LRSSILAPHETQRLFASGAVFEKPHEGQMIFFEATAMATSQTNPTFTPKFSRIIKSP
jgi:hypothetical protein